MADRVPDLIMQVEGTYYWDNGASTRKEYTVWLTGDSAKKDEFILVVLDGEGRIGQSEDYLGIVQLGTAEVDGLARVAATNHDLDEYDDDWVLPVGLYRRVEWALPLGERHSVRLNDYRIGEIVRWLDYATGSVEWDWEKDGMAYDI